MEEGQQLIDGLVMTVYYCRNLMSRFQNFDVNELTYHH